MTSSPQIWKDPPITYSENIFGGFLDETIRMRDSFLENHPHNYVIVKVVIGIAITTVALPLGLLSLIEGVVRFVCGIFVWIAAKIMQSDTIESIYQRQFSKSISSSYISLFTAVKVMVFAWLLKKPLHPTQQSIQNSQGLPMPTIPAAVHMMGLLSQTFQNTGTGLLTVLTEGRNTVATSNRNPFIKTVTYLGVLVASPLCLAWTLVEGVFRVAISVVVWSTAKITRSESVQDLYKRQFSEALPSIARGVMKFVKLVFLGFLMDRRVGNNEQTLMETLLRLLIAKSSNNTALFKEDMARLVKISDRHLKTLIVKLLTKFEVVAPTLKDVLTTAGWEELTKLSGIDLKKCKDHLENVIPIIRRSFERHILPEDCRHVLDIILDNTPAPPPLHPPATGGPEKAFELVIHTLHRVATTLKDINPQRKIRFSKFVQDVFTSELSAPFMILVLGSDKTLDLIMSGPLKDKPEVLHMIRNPEERTLEVVRKQKRIAELTLIRRPSRAQKNELKEVRASLNHLEEIGKLVDSYRKLIVGGIGFLRGLFQLM